MMRLTVLILFMFKRKNQNISNKISINNNYRFLKNFGYKTKPRKILRQILTFIAMADEDLEISIQFYNLKKY